MLRKIIYKTLLIYNGLSCSSNFVINKLEHVSGHCNEPPVNN